MENYITDSELKEHLITARENSLGLIEQYDFRIKKYSDTNYHTVIDKNKEVKKLERYKEEQYKYIEIIENQLKNDFDFVFKKS